jgi:hypothetical protein
MKVRDEMRGRSSESKGMVQDDEVKNGDRE